MSCLNFKASQLGKLNVGVSTTSPVSVGAVGYAVADISARIAETLNSSASRIDVLKVKANRLITDGIRIRTSRDKLIVRAGLICSVSGVKYLNVSPQETQWINDWDILEYLVESNTAWEVKQLNE